MTKDLMPTVEAYANYTIELDKLEKELMQIEKQLLDAKKSRVYAYNKGESKKVKTLDDVISELNTKKKSKTSSFEELCKKQFYMYSTYYNASDISTIADISDLIESIDTKLAAINFESSKLEERKIELFGIAKASVDSETAKKCRDLSSKCHARLVDLTMKASVYTKVKEDVASILSKKKTNAQLQIK